jgi:hypothetical protein
VVPRVGAVDEAPAVYVDPVGVPEDALSPGPQEPAVPVEDDDGVLPPVEDVDPVLGVAGDANDVAELPALGQLPPALDDLVAQIIGTKPDH